MPVMLRRLLLLLLLALSGLPSLADDALPVWDDAQQKELDQARLDLGKLVATSDDSLERTHLLSDLVAMLEQRKDVLRRLGEASQRVADQRSKTASWSKFEPPPPYSILMVDHIRQGLDDAQAEADSSAIRYKLETQEVDDSQKRLDGAEVQVRQASEKLLQASGQADHSRLDEQKLLADLRVRDAAAAMSLGQARKLLTQQDMAEAGARTDLFRKQLALAAQNSSFPRADLDGVLADLDAQQKKLNERLKAAEMEIGDSREALAEAQTELQQAQAINGASSERLAVLARTVDLRRLQADNADLHHESLQHMQETLVWKRSGWQLRWELANSDDREKLAGGLDQLNHLIGRVSSWNQFIQSEYLHSRRLSDEANQDPPGGMPKEMQELHKQFRTAYADNSRILSDTEQVVGDLLRLLTLWREDFQSKRQSASLKEAVLDSWPAVRRGFAKVWNFELLAAEDSLTVDGRKVTAVRSVTVGKSVGLLLLVLTGAVLGHYALRVGRRLAVRRFGVGLGYARTVTRWVELGWISLLLFIALYATNIPLTVFAFLGGAVAIGAGFGAQVLIKNMISGILLLLERPIRVGDIIEAGDVVGTVTHINIRSSTVRTSDGIEVLVPNSSLLEQNVTNWTYSTAQVRKTVSVGVDYESDLEQVIALLRDVAASHPKVSKDPEPQVLLSDFGSDAIIFTLRYWIDYSEQVDASALASDLRLEIARRFDHGGIKIPCQKREITLLNKG